MSILPRNTTEIMNIIVTNNSAIFCKLDAILFIYYIFYIIFLPHVNVMFYKSYRQFRYVVVL